MVRNCVPENLVSIWLRLLNRRFSHVLLMMHLNLELVSGIMIRIQKLKKQAMEHLSQVNLDRARLVTESYKATEGMSSVIQRAEAMANFFLTGD